MVNDTHTRRRRELVSQDTASSSAECSEISRHSALSEDRILQCGTSSESHSKDLAFYTGRNMQTLNKCGMFKAATSKPLSLL